ncbi:MAG: nitronate monooxygenase [Chloroflexota bacterium]|nr:nitronate monooxygenase [Chloroflexota bacterium]
MLKTALCHLLGIEHPIIQGGMMWVGTAELAAAVSNAGGLGIIGAGNSGPDWVREQIHLARGWTEEPFGVNILMTSPAAGEVAAVAREEKVAVVTTGSGSPEVYVSRFKQAGIKVMAVVADASMARRMEKAGVDAVIAEGAEAAGEVGEMTTMVLVPRVVDSVSIPVVAAGGIGDGRGLAAALALGAQGVQVGTRFVCSEECIAHPRYKERIIRAQDGSTVITGQVQRRAVRSLSNRLTHEFQELEKAGASGEELALFSRDRTYLGLVEGNLDDGLLLSGQVAALIGEIKPVGAIINEMVTEAEAIISGLNRGGMGGG